MGAYPHEDELEVLLSEKMDVKWGGLSRGGDYRAKIFNLVQTLENEGRLQEFIASIKDDKPNSPYLEYLPQVVDSSASGIENLQDKIKALQEEVETARVNDDPDIKKLVEDLPDKLKEQPDGQQVITQNISNVKYAATSGSGNASISSITEHGISEDN